MASVKHDEDSEKPLRPNRYRPRKPNYYPEPPSDGYFYPSEPLDPRAILIIRIITIALFLGVGGYAFSAWYFTTQIMPKWPTLQINSIRLYDLKLNVTSSAVDAKWTVTFILQNPDGGWFGRYQPTMRLGDPNYGYLLADKSMGEVLVKPEEDLQKNIEIYSARMTLGPEVVHNIVRDRKRGVFNVDINATVKAMYTKSWTDWDSDPRTIMFYCETIQLKFSSPRTAVAQDLNRDCIQDINPVDYNQNQETISVG